MKMQIAEDNMCTLEAGVFIEPLILYDASFWFKFLSTPHVMAIYSVLLVLGNFNE